MTPSLVVYTAITGSFGDQLRVPLAPVDPQHRRVRYVCFSDCLSRGPSPWEIRPPAWIHPEVPRRTARYHKLNPHKLFPDADYTLWLDGSMQLRCSPWLLVDRYLKRHDVATFRHSERKTLRQEVAACRQLRKDAPTTMQRQYDRYVADGFPDTMTVFETGAVLRANTDQANRLNDAWWGELSRGSFRDQLSLPYVVWKTGTPVVLISGSVYKCPYLIHYPHR